MIIQSKNVYIDGKLMPSQIEIVDSKIVGIYPYGEKEVDIDYKDNMIVPGFIDVHTHGFKGYDTTSEEYDGLIDWLKYLPSEGVTGFLPTTVTESKELLLKALKNVAECKKENHEGAKILGVHFEGPYIAEKYKGAQNGKYIRVADVEDFKDFVKASENLIKVITLAPELDKDFALTKYCRENGINVSMGHSGSDYDTAVKAIEAGANSITHTYNGMSAFHHRVGGLINVALDREDIFAEVICDGNHSSINSLNIFFKCRNKNAIVITDSLMCKGYQVGSKFDFGGQMIEIYPDGSAHLMEGGKNLAGSTLKVNEGLKLLVNKVHVDFAKALDACTINPCRYLNIDDHKGLIKENYDADIVILDNDYNVKTTYVEGKEVFKA